MMGTASSKDQDQDLLLLVCHEYSIVLLMYSYIPLSYLLLHYFPPARFYHQEQQRVSITILGGHLPPWTALMASATSQ